MKLLILSLVFAASALQARTITIETKKIGDKVHWDPSKIEVVQGEKVTLEAKHELEGGFDFHGLFIPELKITEKVDRNKTLKKDVTIPADMKPGEYKVGCHIHPAHVPATLVVKAAPKAK